MNIYRKKSIWKLSLFITAVVIGFSSLVYTNRLVNELKEEERKKVEHWAQAIELVESSDDVNVLNLLSSIIESNNTVPVILTNETGQIKGYRNFDPVKSGDSLYMKAELMRLKEKTEPIVISFGNHNLNYIYYNESTILTRLTYYPYIQLSIIILFITVAYFAFSMARKSEQNQVWVGMSKETAHQLGTPISSLAGWIELLKERYPENDIHLELNRDLERLEKITERFSKIGAKPELEKTELKKLIKNTIHYLGRRSGSRVTYELDFEPDPGFSLPLNASLMEWVFENLFKNAMDAINGEGTISVKVKEAGRFIYADIYDTGKGISKSAFKNIFKPGYSTKTGGWGLGLSLSKRIVETYHDGKIFVLSSEPGSGSCIRIVLKKE